MKRRRGYLLLELMFVLALTGIAATLALHLAHWSLISMGQVREAEARNAAIDQSMTQLRRDVWTAPVISSPDARTVRLGDGLDQITWHFDDTGTVTRTQDDRGQTWKTAMPEVSVAVDPASVELSFPDGRDFRGGRIVMISQVKLLGGIQP